MHPARKMQHEKEEDQMTTRYRIAAIPGDGIGKEVLPEGRRVLEAAGRAYDFGLDFDEYDFASCDYYLQHGAMMPGDWKERLGDCDALFFGAVGWPAKVPDHISLWGSLVQIRRQFDQYVNRRPVRLMPGVASALSDPKDIDFVIIRENTEGEYSEVGGKMFEGTDREVVVQETIMTRTGVDRILRYAFELAAERDARHLTSATKSNGIAISMPYWDERVGEMAASYPQVSWDQFHIDNLCAQLALDPSQFDVIVASNLFGDILSDLGPALTGTIGIAPSANINPEKRFPSLFEPVHGSAPDIAGQGIANPIGTIWAASMLLVHIGEPEAAVAIIRAIEGVLGQEELRTRDLAGPADTGTCGRAVADAVR